MNIIESNRVQAQQNGKDEWLRQRARALQYYRGRTANETYHYFSYKYRRKVPAANNNITRRVIDRTSLIYMDAPDRIVSNERYIGYTQAKNQKLQRAERWCNLLGLVAIHPVFRHGRLEYDLITDFEPTFGDDPLVPIAIDYPVAAAASVRDTTPETWAHWDAEEYIVYYNGGGHIVREPNELGLLPFVWAFRDGVPETTFLDVDVCEDLLATNLTINVLTTAMHGNILFQSHGYPYASGVNDDRTIPLSPDVILGLPNNGRLDFATPPNTVDAVVGGIKYLYQTVAQNYHLSTSFVEGTTAESGIALKIRNQELMEDRKSDLIRWRELESEIYKIERALLRTYAGFDPGEEFAVDFKENSEMLTPDEQQARDTWDLEHNLVNLVELLMRRNPDLDEKQAEEQIKRNMEINGGKTGVSLSELLGG